MGKGVKFQIERSEQEQRAMEGDGLETEFSIIGENESRYKGAALSKICTDHTKEGLLF